MTAMYVALGLVSAGCLAVLALSAATPARLIAVTAATLLALQARVMTSAWQRLAALLPAVAGGALVVVSASAAAAPRIGIAVVGGLLAVAGLLYIASQMLAGRRLLPYWGRIGDIAQTACALAMLPLVLWLLGTYQYARGLGG
jgi:hypothetical protein